ncbi:MAG: hypothetical protein LBS34_00310 [Rickettsiales bacterium]|jgi:G:T/U-mismatch repair DNA glycosylase|nr:hypothetical protein [Rickettsiales bacterium]
MENYIASLDEILTEIREQTLTDMEIETIKPKDPESLQEKYDTLNTILTNRGGIGNSLKKLRANAAIANIYICKPAKLWNNVFMCGGINGR